MIHPILRRLAVAALAVLLGLGVQSARPALAVTCATAPVGAANLPPTDPEPTGPIWCAPLAAAPPATGASDGFGGYVDTFANGVSGTAPAAIPAQYTLQEDAGASGGAQTEHWTMNGYFGSDIAKTATFDGADLSPNQTFSFQNGKLVLEADVAAAEPGFADSNGGDVVWHEIVWSGAQQLNAADTNDALYSYGYYKGFWAAGCRLQAARSLTCAVEADHVLSSVTGDQPPCFSVSPSRVMELSGHQACGTVHSGFSVSFGAPSNAWRVCPTGTVDPCLDRFRLEWSQAGLVAYINGIKFAEDSGWPAGSQLPAGIVDGSTPVYAHFADWGVSADSNVYRFHWGRIAVNPHDAAGNPLPPSASPTFGQAPPSPSPTPTPTPSPTGTPTPTPAPTPFACNLHYGGSGHAGTCLRQSDGSIRFVAS